MKSNGLEGYCTIKMSFSNYEQTVIIDSVSLSGVTNVKGSYSIKEKPIKIAGVGFIDALVDGPAEGDFTISRQMVSRDPIIKYAQDGSYLYDQDYISGAILYDNNTKGFGFTKGRITKYSVSCQVGEIPTISTDIRVFGNLGSGINVALATKEHPKIQFPDQESISIVVGDFSADSITDFSYTRSLDINPVYAIPKGTSVDWVAGTSASFANQDPVQTDVQYPIQTDITFTMIPSEYEVRQMKDKFKKASKTDVVIDILDSRSNESVASFTGKNVRLISESVNSTIEGEMSISLSYKGYETLHNPVS